jgi:hypothetical protein
MRQASRARSLDFGARYGDWRRVRLAPVFGQAELSHSAPPEAQQVLPEARPDGDEVSVETLRGDFQPAVNLRAYPKLFMLEGRT